MKKKLSASERLKIKDKQFYNSLTEKQKKQIDKIKQDSFMKQTAEAQKIKYSTGPKMKTPDKKMKGVTLQRKGVTLKYKAVKKKKK